MIDPNVMIPSLPRIPEFQDFLLSKLPQHSSPFPQPSFAKPETRKINNHLQPTSEITLLPNLAWILVPTLRSTGDSQYLSMDGM
jgi:hypothetical protein